MGLFKKEKSLDQASMKEGVGLITLTAVSYKHLTLPTKERV